MWVKKVAILAFFLFVTACTQDRSFNLPEGITLLQGIDPSGLHYPIWSPDGKSVVASCVIEPMADFPGHKPCHDIVMIDTETWELSIFVSEKWGNLMAETWAPDSQSFVMFWSDGPDGNGNYLFEVGDTKSTYFSNSGTLSPDLEKMAVFDNPYIKVTDIRTHDIQAFKTPINGNWSVYSWSPDMKQLTMTYRENENDRHENIYLLNVNSGSFIQFTNESSFYKNHPTISPDGQLIAYGIWRFTENSIETKVIISRLDQSCEWTLPLDSVDYFTWSPDSQRMFLIGTDGVYIADLGILFGKDFSGGHPCP